MENTDPKGKSTEEIDITQFFRWIGRGFYRVGHGLLFLMAATRNLFFHNIKFFLIVILTGLLLGFLYFKLLSREYYKSTMVLNCTFLNTQIVANTIDKLNLLCNESDRKGLALELGIPDSLARNIVQFESQSFVSEDDIVEMEVLKEQLSALAEDKKEIIDKVINRITIENKDAYSITVTVLQPGVVKVLEGSLVNYFRNSEYIKRRIEITKQVRSLRKEKIIKESRKLDSLKMIIIQNLENLSKDRGSNNVILNEDKLANPIEVFREDLTLNQELLGLEQNLYLQPDFEVIDGFTGFTRPQSPGLPSILAISLLISFVSAYLILLAWKFDRVLARYPTNR